MFAGEGSWGAEVFVRWRCGQGEEEEKSVYSGVLHEVPLTQEPLWARDTLLYAEAA